MYQYIYIIQNRYLYIHQREKTDIHIKENIDHIYFLFICLSSMYLYIYIYNPSTVFHTPPCSPHIPIPFFQGTPSFTLRPAPAPRRSAPRRGAAAPRRGDASARCAATGRPAGATPGAATRRRRSSWRCLN